ncbi:hypothetical protein MKW94_014286, partial [Papaver nudicaule]|nr:hypothetical protein [Papaver nudicaule]
QENKEMGLRLGIAADAVESGSSSGDGLSREKTYFNPTNPDSPVYVFNSDLLSVRRLQHFIYYLLFIIFFTLVSIHFFFFGSLMDRNVVSPSTHEDFDAITTGRPQMKSILFTNDTRIKQSMGMVDHLYADDQVVQVPSLNHPP